jgi:hypothetical protein
MSHDDTDFDIPFLVEHLKNRTFSKPVSGFQNLFKTGFEWFSYKFLNKLEKNRINRGT